MTDKTLILSAIQNWIGNVLRIAHLLGFGRSGNETGLLVDAARVVGMCRLQNGKFSLTAVRSDIFVKSDSWGITVRVEEDDLRHDLSHLVRTGAGLSAAVVSSHGLDVQARNNLVGALIMGAFRAQEGLPKSPDLSSMLIGTDRSGDVLHVTGAEDGALLHVMVPGDQLYPYMTLGTVRHPQTDQLMLVLGLRGDGQLYLADPATFSSHLKGGVISKEVWTKIPPLNLGVNRVARVGRMTPTDHTPVMMEDGEVWLVQLDTSGQLKVIQKMDLSRLILRLMSDDVTGVSGRKWLILGVTRAVLDERGRGTFAFVRRGNDNRSVEWHFMPIDHPMLPPELTGLWDPSRARTTVVPTIRRPGNSPSGS